MAFSLEELEQQLRSTHGHARIEAFLWGLLPDNDRVLQNWGRRFQVSPKNVFRLISHVG
jgi:serine/threonine-protein kinase HipA